MKQALRRASRRIAGWIQGNTLGDEPFLSKRQEMKKYWEFDRETFIVLKQPYDSIHRPSMWKILSEIEVSKKLMRLIELCNHNNVCKV